ncbi:MAG TPA: DUF4397 domain-containing protein [Casimicrobiaceae bacterium]|nr:DUF4397 domain-containing protein [Casimicrobiaceae bacterium]
MTPTRMLFLAGCLVTLLLGGCGKSSNDNANVRVLNLIQGAPSVTVTANGTTVLANGSFESITPFTSVGVGTVEFKVTVPGSTGTLVDTVFSLGTSEYTYVTTGTPGAAAAVLVADPYGSPSGNNFAVRVLNMSATNALIDLYLTAPGADLASATPVVSGAAYGIVSSFVTTPAGGLQVRLTTSGTKDVLYDATPPAIAAGTGQTIVAYGRQSNKLVNVAMMASQTTGAIANSTLAQLKVVNGTSVPAPLNVLVDGAPAVSALAFAGVAPYQLVAAGTRTVAVESSASPGAALLTLTPNLVAATDNSIALYGSAGAMSALTLADANPPIAVGRASLRVVNVSPDLSSVDVYANFGKIVSTLGANAASAYTLVDAVSAGTPYRFDVNAAGTTTTLASVAGVTLVSAHGYTLYLLGTGATLQGVLTQDR